MKLLSYFFPSGKDEINAEDAVGAIVVNPENLAEELTALKVETDRREDAHAAAMVEAEGREKALADQLEAKNAAYASLLQSIVRKDEEIATLQTEVETAKTSADSLANQKLRSVGHDPIAVDASPTDQSVLEKYRAMPAGKERMEFRKANKSAIQQQLDAEQRGAFA